MEIELPDEVFLSSGTFHSVYPSCKDSSTYLLRVLKTKEYNINRIFTQFLYTLHHLLKSSQFNIVDFILPLLTNLREISAPAIISKKLIMSLELILKDYPDLLQLEPLSSVLSDNWEKIEVESLDLLFKVFKICKPEEELYNYTKSLWHTNQLKKAIYVSSHFGLAVKLNQERFESEFKALNTLIKKNEIDLVQAFIKKNKNLASMAVKKMSTSKNCKIAGKIVDSQRLDPAEFPELITRLAKNSISYFVNVDEIAVKQFVTLVEDQPQILAYVAEELEFQGKKVKNSWQGRLAAWILQQHPECPVRPSSLSQIELMEPRPNPQPDDLFSPLQPEYELVYPLPRESVCFVASPQQVQTLDFSGEVIGIDCEWRPSVVKFQKFKVSLIQIASESRTYIIDLLALNGLDELNVKLEQLMQGKQFKVGVNFEGDRKMLGQSYPHLTAFKKPLVNYVDLASAYGKVHGTSPGGLSGTCELILGKSLCKYQQRSNWERRPLYESQIHYAALDAYVQILVLQELVKSSGLGLEEFVGNFKNFNSRGINCEFCSSKAHNKGECPRGKRCKICFRTGHLVSNCLW